LHNATTFLNLTLNVIGCTLFSQFFFLPTTIYRRNSRKKSKPMVGYTRNPLFSFLRTSNASEDERWLAHKSYSQMPSERNGGVGRGLKGSATVVVNICRCVSSTAVGRPYQRPLLTPSPLLHPESRPPPRTRSHSIPRVGSAHTATIPRSQ